MWRWSESERTSYETPWGSTCAESLWKVILTFPCIVISSKRDQNIIPVSGEKFKRIVKVILLNSKRQCMWTEYSYETPCTETWTEKHRVPYIECGKWWRKGMNTKLQGMQETCNDKKEIKKTPRGGACAELDVTHKNVHEM